MGILTDRRRQEALHLLQDAIAIITVNPSGNEQPLAEYIARYLRDTMCEVDVQPFAHGRANVLATLHGKNEGGTLAYNGHLDTVPFGNPKSWLTPPAQGVVRDGAIYGRGSSDLKGALCAALYAFRQVALELESPNYSLIFTGTGDEESNGLGAQSLVESGLLSRVSGMVVGAPTAGQISVASKGALWLEITVRGQTSHAAYPQEGCNAAEIAMELFYEVRGIVKHTYNPYLSNPTCTLTQISSGIKSNVIPDLCTMSIDIRTVPGISHGGLYAKLDDLTTLVASRHPGVRIERKIMNNRTAVEISPDDPLTRLVAGAIQQVTGRTPELIGTNFFSDASIFLRSRALPILLYGPGDSGGTHKPNEYLMLQDYFESIECMYQLFKQVAMHGLGQGYTQKEVEPVPV